MADDFSILPQWKRLLPSEKVGSSKESLIGQVEKEILQQNKKKKKGQSPQPEQNKEEEGKEEVPDDSGSRSGKIVDIVI